MYYINSDWIGGLYATPSFPGSRSGFGSAGAWYSMINVTKKGYK
jgi:sphinganine-1-phosphate aldolase